MDAVQYPIDFTPVTTLLCARLVCRRTDADEFEIAIAQPNVDEVRRGVRIHGGRGDIANVKGQTAGNEHLVVPWKSLCRVNVFVPGGIKPLPQLVPADTLIDKFGQEDDIGADMFQSGAEFLRNRLLGGSMPDVPGCNSYAILHGCIVTARTDNFAKLAPAAGRNAVNCNY